MVLAMAADALQIFVFPLFAGGAFSPADDLLDIAVAAVLVRLLGWHWEFLPAFAAELVPGVDLVPFWTWLRDYQPKLEEAHREYLQGEEGRLGQQEGGL